jgi:subtilisin family serine protease
MPSLFPHWAPGRVLPLAALFVLSSLCAAAPQPGDDLAVWYFKDRRPLALDPTRIAILADSDRAQAGVLDSVTRVLPTGTRVEPSVVRGWQTARHDDGFGSTADVLVAADALTLWPDQFVTPVFADEYGPLHPTPWILVQFAERLDHIVVEAILAGADAAAVTIEPFGDLPNAYRVRSAHRNGVDVLSAAERLAQREDVLFAEPDMLATGRFELIPNDPLFAQQWALQNVGQAGGFVDMDMDADQAWDQTTGSATVKVLILDNGIQQDHPDLNQVAGYDGTGSGTGGGPGNVCDNHGTTVAGCVAAIINNSVGVVGVAPGVKVASGRMGISNLSCDGSFQFLSSYLVNALTFGESIGAKVSNSSFTVGSSSSITTKYQSTRTNGMVHYAATGNSGVNSISYPASLTAVQAVAALGPAGTLASFSNYGTGLDVSAPGVNILTTDRTGSAGYSSGDTTSADGTSYASPYAAGVAALVVSAFPAFTVTQVEEAVQRTCVDLGAAGYDTTYGYGFVNARNAINYSTSTPGNFNLLSPAPGEMGVSRLPTFTWSSAAGAVTYRLIIDDAPDFATPIQTISNISEISYTLLGSLLPAETTLYWTVDAINSYGTRDSTPLSASFTTLTDCNNNNIHDPAEIAGNPALDCNGNGRIDSCDVSGGFTPDCNANGIPDSCDIAACGGSPLCDDCNANGIPDSCDIASGAAIDCNNNDVPDTCDLINCTGQAFCDDCNNNGVIDACDLAADFASQSPNFAPLGNGFPHTYTITSPPAAVGDVLFTFNAVGDLSAANETVSVTLNGTPIGILWDSGGIDCTEVTDTLMVAAAPYNAAVAGGDAVIVMTASSSVTPTPAGCTGQTFIRVRVEYVGTSTSQDANSNGIPDECEGPAGCAGDADCDGDVDFFDIDPFVGKLGCPGSGAGCNDGCGWQNSDVDGDGDADFFDIDPFVARLGQGCP